MLRGLFLFTLSMLLCIGALAAQSGSDGVYLQVLRLGSKEEAERVMGRVRTGQGFDELVEEFAPDGLKERKGCVGKVFPNRLGKRAKDAIGRLRTGELAGPIQGETEWFVARVLEETNTSGCEAPEGDLAFWLERGLILGELGDEEGEIEAYRKAVSIEPRSAEAHANLGEALRRKGVRILQEAASSSKRVPEDVVTEILDEAIDEFKKAIALDKNLWEAHFDLGLAYGAQGLLDLTVLEFSEALRIREDSGELHRAMAQVLIILGRVDEAREHLRRASELGVRVEDLQKELEKKSKEPAKRSLR